MIYQLDLDSFGYPISSHPIAKYRSRLNRKIIFAKDIQKYDRKSVYLLGIYIARKESLTNKSEPMEFLTLEDETDTYECILFPDVYKQFSDLVHWESLFIVKGKVDLDKLIISKSLRGFYKNPDSIAHKVLAERIGKRDAGKKPSVGSRVPYVYIQTKGKVKLQGDKIESPDYIRENDLRPDYIHYVTNQIQKPVTQIFSLLLEDIPEFKKKVMNFQKV